MRLLFITQKMDRRDSVLGAYHAWVTKLASYYESVEVICLEEGEHALPENVRVHSLGKEKRKESAVVYAVRFKWLAWKLRNEYDTVLVHMNQEYLLIGGPLWKLTKKRMYLWRNHYAGSVLTDIAVLYCDKVFCTSRASYTAKYAKTVFMPVGVNEELFTSSGPEKREPRSLLFLARIAPSKRPDLFIDALTLLIARGVSFIARIYGSPLPEDERYYQSLKQQVEEQGLHGRVEFHAAVPNSETPRVYRSHEAFVNCSRSGMFDKTLFEALACGCAVFAESEDYRALAGDAYAYESGNAKSLAEALLRYLDQPDGEREIERKRLSHLALSHTLSELAGRLYDEMQS